MNINTMEHLIVETPDSSEAKMIEKYHKQQVSCLLEKVSVAMDVGTTEEKLKSLQDAAAAGDKLGQRMLYVFLCKHHKLLSRDYRDEALILFQSIMKEWEYEIDVLDELYIGKYLREKSTRAFQENDFSGYLQCQYELWVFFYDQEAQINFLRQVFSTMRDGNETNIDTLDTLLEKYYEYRITDEGYQLLDGAEERMEEMVYHFQTMLYEDKASPIILKYMSFMYEGLGDSQSAYSMLQEYQRLEKIEEGDVRFTVTLEETQIIDTPPLYQ